MKPLSRTIAALLFAQPIVALADGLPINPGMWESTVVTNNPLAGTQTSTSKECIKEQEFDLAKILADTDGCNVIENVVSGNTLTFTMSCNIEGGQGTMSGVYTSDGDSGSGEMTMHMSFGGQTIKMDSTMSTKRIGDC